MCTSWTHIGFNQPALQVLVDDKVEPVQLKARGLLLHDLRHSSEYLGCDIFNLTIKSGFPGVRTACFQFWIFFIQFGDESVCAHHEFKVLLLFGIGSISWYGL